MSVNQNLAYSFFRMTVLRRAYTVSSCIEVFICKDIIRFEEGLAAKLERKEITMECYISNKTTDVPVSITNNCMPNALH